jgi:hypothetical protein
MSRLSGLWLLSVVAGGLGPAMMACGSGGDPDGCAGEVVGDYCWYLGADSRDCIETCTPHGGTTEGTIVFAGSEGSLGNCSDVARAFGKPAAQAQDTTLDTAEYVYMGCMWAGAYDETYWLHGHRTNQTAKYGADHRFCSCAR